ncbi:uncharacterized protein LOC132272550 [Cornus florida]|uniref:uncharacterized protein LOC132272550 n=1 Tax=Cornus florida TaxID=4283 RepID=UPI0028993407|nr:uncharacterized protein LOC132272550 [Cornus florida]
MKDGFFQVQFPSKDDLLQVLSRFHTFQRRAIIVKKWHKSFQLECDILSSVPIWMKVYDLPVHARSGISVSKVVSNIAKPLYMDAITLSRERGLYVRVLAEMEVDGNFPETIQTRLHGVKFKVQNEYEWKPQVCSLCKKMEHSENMCPLNKIKVTKSKEQWVVKKSVKGKEVCVDQNLSLIITDKISEELEEGFTIPRKLRGKKRVSPVSQNPIIAKNAFQVLNESVESEDSIVPMDIVGTTEFLVSELDKVKATGGISDIKEDDNQAEVNPLMLEAAKNVVQEVQANGKKVADAVVLIVLADGKKAEDDAAVIAPVSLEGSVSSKKQKKRKKKEIEVDSSVEITGTVSRFFVTFVYANNTARERTDLCKSLMESLPLINGPWMLIGDWNIVRCNSEKLGGRYHSPRVFAEFNHTIDSLCLTDIPVTNGTYTWFNNRFLNRRIYARLDRGLMNEEWDQTYPNAQIVLTPPLTSDQWGLILHLPMKIADGPKPFRFLTVWNKEIAVKDIISDVWNLKTDGDPIKKMLYKLKLVKQTVKQWNKDKFGSQEEEGRRKLEATISNEALTLAQKSRIQWVKDQDRCSKYFFQKIKQHRQGNNITEIHDEGEVFTDPTLIKTKFVDYFKSAYANFQPASQIPQAKYIRKRLVTDEIERLEEVVLKEEIKSTVLAMGSDRAPGPDGFSTRFFQQFWGIVGEEFTDAILQFFDHPEMGRGINRIMEAEVQSGKVIPTEAAVKSGIPITHQFFADDLLIVFEKALGLAVSKEKSEVFITNSVRRKTGIIRSLGCKVGKLPFTYLGFPISDKMVRSMDCNKLVEKVISLTTRWNGLHLSIAGRVELSRAVILPLVHYWTSVFSLPAVIINIIERKMRNYIWGYVKDKKKMHGLRWNKFVVPKEEGGLGLRRLRDIDKAAKCSLTWDFLLSKDRLWVAWFKENYLRHSSFWNVIPKESSSSIWKIAGREIIKENCRYRIRNGQQIQVFLDPWCEGLEWYFCHSWMEFTKGLGFAELGNGV